MGIRLIAVDLDGTLMNGKNQIMGETMKVLRQAADSGIHIVPSTGRCLALLPGELRRILGIRYAILANGACIWDNKTNTFLYRKELPEGIARKILEITSGVSGYVELFIKGEAYVDISQLNHFPEDFLDQNFVKYYKQNHIFVKGIKERSDLLEKAEKVNLFYQGPDVKRQLEKWLAADGRCAVTSSISGNIEVQNVETNKGHALELLCRMLGIEADEVVAFGDSDNDLEMLEFAGTGVAMGNAADHVKNVADEVTLTNEEDGVGTYVKRILV